ncbi:hypothetical protein HRbin27_01999 [bacterium HR27]|nr:hypothetical protein HRbin27_01999 [bacterium HR27]
MGDHRHTEALAPGLELVDRRRAERISCDEQDRPPLIEVVAGQLGDRRRLAGAVDPDDERDERHATLIDLDAAIPHRCVEQRDHFVTQCLTCLGWIADFAATHTLAEPLEQCLGRRYPEVSLNQQRLQIFEQFLVDRVALEQLDDLPEDPLATPLETCFELWSRRGTSTEEATEDHDRLLGLRDLLPEVWRRSDDRGADDKYTCSSCTLSAFSGTIACDDRPVGAHRGSGGACLELLRGAIAGALTNRA